MPRGAEYDNGIPQSDNAIEAGENKAHGTNPVRTHSPKKVTNKDPKFTN
jgi:hypothetical protein